MRTILTRWGTLRMQLLSLALLILLPVCALLVYNNLRMRKNEKTSIQDHLIATSRFAASGQKNYFENARQMLTTLTQFPFLMEATNGTLGELSFSNLILLSPDYLNFGMIEPDGTLFCDGLKDNESIRLNDQSYFQKVLKTRSMSVGNLQDDPLLRIPCLNFGYPVISTNKELKKILFASLKLDILSQELAQVPLDADGILLVIDPMGTIIARFPDSEKWVGHKLPPELLKKIASQHEGTFQTSSIDDVDRLCAVTPIASGPASSFFAIVALPEKASYAHAEHALVRSMLIMLVITIVTFVAALFFSRRLFLQPVNLMISAAHELSTGNLSARTGIQRNNSELSHLARAFDEMAESLTKRQKELEFANEQIKHNNFTLEEKIKERTAQLETSNQELESFSYSVSHDLRAPLRHIAGFVDLLQKSAKETLNASDQRYLNIIANSAKQMGQLIDDLISFSRMRRAEMQATVVDLNQIVEETISGLQTDIGTRKITWHKNRLPILQADPALLRQVFVNLISNAVKYTKTREEAVIEIGSKEENNETVIYIRDNGAGFDMQFAGKLFGVFQRLHHASEFEGTGIGLASVRRIIQRHHGKTWAEGVVGKGATFYFSLPKKPNQT